MEKNNSKFLIIGPIFNTIAKKSNFIHNMDRVWNITKQTGGAEPQVSICAQNPYVTYDHLEITT